MATIKDWIGKMTGAGSYASRYKKSARTSAKAFAKLGALDKTAARRKSLGGKGG